MSIDRDRALPADVTRTRKEPGILQRQRRTTVPGSLGEIPTVVLAQPAEKSVSPQRANLRAELPNLFATKSISELATQFGVTTNEVRSDIANLQRKGMLPRKTIRKTGANLPYEQAFQRAVQFDTIVRNAVEANNKVTLPEIIEVLQSQIDWAEIDPDAARVVFTRVKKEFGIEEPRPTRRKKTTI